MSSIFLLHVDTATAVPQYNLYDKNTTINNPRIKKHNGNPFCIVYNFTNPRNNVRMVTLRSAEIPVGFYNIRAPYNVFSLVDSDMVRYDYAIPPGYYPDIQSIITALNNSRDLYHDEFILLNGTTLFINGTQIGISQEYVNLSIVTTNANGEPNLGSLLGFREGQVCNSGTTIYGLSPYRISFDDYINMYIPYLRGSSSEPYPVTFKIPVDNKSMIFYTSSKTFEQTIINTDTSQRFQTLEIHMLDRFGNQLDNNGLDWSFTLEIFSDT